MKRNAQLVESFQNLRIHLSVAGFLFGGGIERDLVIIDFIDQHMTPRRTRLLLPPPVGIQSELKHPVRFAFLLRNQPDHLLVQTHRNHLGLNVGSKSIFIFA